MHGNSNIKCDFYSYIENDDILKLYKQVDICNEETVSSVWME